MAEFATGLNNQYEEYGDIEANLDCTDVSTSYMEYKEPLCGRVKNGFLELLALRVISLPLEIGLCIVGIRFVLRNKVDVPRYIAKKEGSKGKKKGKGGKKGGKSKKDGNALDDRQDDDNSDDQDNSGSDDDKRGNGSSDSDDSDEGNKSKGCFLCCCCRGKGKHKSIIDTLTDDITATTVNFATAGTYSMSGDKN